MIDLPLDTYKEGAFEAFNSGGVEKEVGEFLYSMVRVLKPQRILESGTHKGISAAYMGKALQENGSGELITIEFDSQHWDDENKLWDAIGIENEISVFRGRVEDFKPEGEYGLLFLDSEPEYRFNELVRFYPYLKPGGYVFIHDLPRDMTQGNFNPDHPEYKSWPFGDMPEEMKEWLKSGELVSFHFPNPRGMVGFYKKHPSDFRP